MILVSQHFNENYLMDSQNSSEENSAPTTKPVIERICCPCTGEYQLTIPVFRTMMTDLNSPKRVGLESLLACHLYIHLQ